MTRGLLKFLNEKELYLCCGIAWKKHERCLCRCHDGVDVHGTQKIAASHPYTLTTL
jgi:hypothetical protein